MQVELLTIGSEITRGATVNTNAAYVARRLGTLGLVCRRQVAVPDEPVALRAALREALERADIVLTTGGLGPTFDDVTAAAIADTAGRPLVSSPAAAAHVRRFYKSRHRRLQRAALRQAQVPQGTVLLPNALGTAPGLWLRTERPHGRSLWDPEPGRLQQGLVRDVGTCLIIALPGVPAEMRWMLDHAVLPRLRRLARGPAAASTTLRTVGILELRIEQRLKRLHLPANLEIGLYPHLQTVDVQLTATAPTPAQAARQVSQAARVLRRALGSFVYGTGEETLAEAVGSLCLKRRATVALAESCTGGLVAKRLTDVAGSSRYVRGGIVAYHNDLKRQLLGVPAGLLSRHGAVSPEVAKAMAEGVRRLAGATVGLSVTGIAGPSGGSAKKPVGLVYLGLTDRRGTHALMRRFHGNRAGIRAQAVHIALDLLRRRLSRLPPPSPH
jgi:nicotinamide-nucleotide amidase